MNSKVKEYLDTAKAKEEAAKAKERDQLLISLGLVDKEKSKKVYSNVYRDGYSWDEKEEKYYYISQAPPIEVTDEEYAEIVKYAKKDKIVNTTNNGVEIFLLTINIIILLASTILFFVNLGDILYDIVDYGIWLVMFIFSLFSFASILVFIKISKNLNKIKDKIDAIEKDKK